MLICLQFFSLLLDCELLKNMNHVLVNLDPQYLTQNLGQNKRLVSVCYLKNDIEREEKSCYYSKNSCSQY